MARVFQRAGSPIWYYAYYHRGKEIARSAQTIHRNVAQRQLRAALKRLGTGYEPDDEKLTFADLMEKVRLDREISQRRCDDLAQRRAHLEPFFGGERALEITTECIERYVLSRRAEGAAPATINRELALLRRAFVLSELARKPRIVLLPENNARRDFLSYAEFGQLREHLAPEFRDIITFMYLSSWRQSQVAALEWRDVDLTAGEVTARDETTKSGKPHRIPLTGELRAIVERARIDRRMDCPFVFHRAGQPFRLRGGKAPIRQAWGKACAAIGLSGHVMHGLRRSGISNMIQAGVDPMTAMAVSGHRTMAMLSRYNIITTDAQRQALDRTFAHIEAQPGDNKVRAIR